MRTYIRDYKWGKIVLLHYDFISDFVNFYGEWADLEVSLFLSILEVGDDVIEVGCNIGTHTIPLCQFVGNTGKVIGFEPQRVLYQMLCGNMAINNLTNAYLYHDAVGDMDGEIYVPSQNYDTKGNYGGLSLGSYAFGEKIALRSLDSLEIIGSLTKLKLIKIDVEGMEANVIQGAKHLISKFRPFLFVENDRKDKGNALIDLLHDLEYDCYWFCTRRFNPNNFNGATIDITQGIGDYNVLCIPREQHERPSFLQKVKDFNELVERKVHWVEAVDPNWYKSSRPVNSEKSTNADFQENGGIYEGLERSIEFYQQAIATNPDLKSNYWHLGLALLLQGEVEEAQMVWLSAVSDMSPEQLESALIELTQILEAEAQNREAIADFEVVWLIRHHICENNPEDLNNLLKLILASIEIKQFVPANDIHLEQAIELLTCEPLTHFDLSPPILLSTVLKKLVELASNLSSETKEEPEPIQPLIDEFADACVSYYCALQTENPHVARYPYLLGSIYAEIARTDEAIACYNQALKLNPNYAEVYFCLGNMELRQGNEDRAMAQYQKAIAIQPNFPKPYVNLAYILERRSQLESATIHLRQAIQIDPSFAEAYRNLGVLLRKLGRVEEAITEYQQALKIKPKDALAYANLADAFVALGRLDEAIPYYQAVTTLQPNHAGAYYELGNIFFRKNQLEQAIESYQTAINLNPEFIDAYNNLILILIGKTDLGEPFYKLWRQITDQYANLSERLRLQNGVNQEWISPITKVIRSNLMSGNHQVALDKFLALEKDFYRDLDNLTQADIANLYGELLFFVLFLRDDRAANTKFFRQVGERYVNHVLKPNQDPALVQACSSRFPPDISQRKLKIGILSRSFRRHATAWCCGNFIEELAKLTPHLYLYDTGKYRDDDLTTKFEQIAAKYYRSDASTVQEIGKLVTAELLKDEVDIMIELDSMMNVVSAEVLNYHPAPICVSWPGLEAPFLSEQNYFLCDRHLIPEACDRYYLEHIIRMPDSYLAVTDLKHDLIDREVARRSLGIAPDQIVYLSITAGHKFNRAVAHAAVQILRQVPQSILLCKGKGDAEIVRGVYQQECDLLGVTSDRIKFLPPRAKTEEAHRSTYLLADVLLDSHPYNSCTHSLEAMWLNLPIVTIAGDQFFARFGYSFLQTLNIQAGIAWNWQEYIEWGVKLGLDRELRNSIRAHLARSKQPETLSPLWNPKKFATDMYAIFEELLDKNFKQNLE
ncbi:FkbM family methyltransferase [Tumidithrix elongata RA019]|uniref:protein O-GlcNAc transferase n=1 Tax=Tumidithrix elongata BACA0141 TaxID=2716417 RepID=A0AAW9Q0X2_9CYAN|nr:FkbM family methyltransferase [Tumidithrix elongata RA019]